MTTKSYITSVLGGAVETEIHRIALGFTNCYLIRQEALILIDAGNSKKGKRFIEQLKAISIKPSDISLIFVTHGHWDHVGSLYELKSMTGCQVAANQHEKDCIEQALKAIPPGVGLWGKLLRIIINLSIPFINFRGTHVDVVLEDKEFPLERFGIHGKILYTPGHTLGSMSLLLDTGDAFIGDLAVNAFPMRIGPGVPRFAEDINAVKESWRLILDKGAKQIYPGHGKPFKSEKLAEAL